MNRRTLFATIAGLFCVRAKAEEPKMRVFLTLMHMGVPVKEWAWEEGNPDKHYVRNVGSKEWVAE